ncbi:GNAT family N-acetyltransferase [Georgenia daeguensis]|uniref:N-acetyltransferase domain-containing protein n=1 Tax=Georgenia daeguensis TaxID=908355 RepID=A0ABP8EUG5_9MICO
MAHAPDDLPPAGSTLVRPLGPEEVRTAVALLARGMRDNPLHLAAYGRDERLRRARHARLLTGRLDVAPTLALAGAFRGGVLVGVCGAAPAGTCRLTTVQRLRMLPTLARLGPAAAARVLAWTGAWSRHDPTTPHVHLGPVGVDAHLQGRGVGTALLAHHCRRLDAEGQVGYLETDRPQNVSFYSRFGYAVVGEETVLGVANWFMARDPSAA